MGTRLWSNFGLAIVLLLASATAADAIEVVDARWGFEGLLVPGAFNFVTVTVLNTGRDPFDGVLALRPNLYGRTVGVPVQKKLYIAPGGTARVQLHVFIKNQTHDWRLSWGRGPSQGLNLNMPPVGSPAQVFLESPHLSVPSPGGVRKFPEQQFPTSSAVLSTLHEVALAHTPEWTPEQTSAFKNWVRAGGVVHVLLDASGTLPVFDGELTPLNGDVGESAWGNGRVVRHSLPVKQATHTNLGWPASNTSDSQQRYFDDSETQVGNLLELSNLSKPDHNWPLIYGLSLLYLVLVVPVNAIIGKKVRDYRVAILFLIVCVGVFSLIFTIVGARGYGEKAIIHTVARAEVLGEGDYDVMRWSHAFVTQGDRYEFRYGNNDAYDSILRRELEPGLVGQLGGGRGIMFDMPLYSSRSYVTRGMFRRTGVFIRGFANGSESGPPSNMLLNVGAGFPKHVHNMWMRVGEEVWELSRDSEGRLRTVQPTRTLHFSEEDQQVYYYDNSETETHPELKVAGRRLGVRVGYQPLPKLPESSVQVVVIADLPEEFHNQGSLLEQGKIVYHQVLRTD